MSEWLTNELKGMVTDLNRVRNQDVGQFAAGALGKATPEDMARWNRGPLSKEQKLAIRSQLIDQMTNIQKMAIEGREDVLKQMVAMRERDKSVDGIVNKLLETRGSEAKQLNDLRAKLLEERAQAVAKALESGSSSAAVQAYRLVTNRASIGPEALSPTAMSRGGIPNGEALINNLLQYLSRDSALSPQEKDEAYRLVALEFAAKHGQDLREFLATYAKDGGPLAGLAQQVLADLQTVNLAVPTAKDEQLLGIYQTFAQSERDLLQQYATSPELAWVVNAVKALDAAMNPNSGADAGAMLEQAFKALDPQGKPGAEMLEQLDKALEGLEAPDIQNQPNAWAARRALFESQEFQEAKQKAGFQDDAMFLKHIRRQMKRQRGSDRAKDRERLVGAREEESPASAAATNFQEPEEGMNDEVAWDGQQFVRQRGSEWQPFEEANKLAANMNPEKIQEMLPRLYEMEQVYKKKKPKNGNWLNTAVGARIA